MTATTLYRELERAERGAGLRPGIAVTEGLVTRRQVQIAAVLALAAVTLVALAVAPGDTLPSPAVRWLTLALAATLAGHAYVQDRHLRQLVRLHREMERVNLEVADALAHCGALDVDAHLLVMRDALRDASGDVARTLAAVIGAERVWVRVPGPSGELPTHLSRRAVRRGGPLLVSTDDGRSALAVPVWRAGEPIAVLEAVAPPGMHFAVADIALANACAAGAAAVARTSP